MMRSRGTTMCGWLGLCGLMAACTLVGSVPVNYQNCQETVTDACGDVTFVPNNVTSRCRVCIADQNTTLLCDCFTLPGGGATTGLGACRPFLDDSGACYGSCPAGIHQSGGPYRCERCAPGCEACIGGGPEDCVRCLHVALNGTCLDACPAGHVDRDGRCIPTALCGGFVVGDKCQASCPDGHYADVDSGTGRRVCDKCDPLCSTCTDRSASSCLSCAMARAPNGSCVTACPRDAPLVGDNNACVSSCPRVTKVQEGRCVTRCDDAHRSVYEEVCYRSCPHAAPLIMIRANYGYNDTCIDEAGCRKADMVTWEGHCVAACPRDLLRHNHTCTAACPPDAALTDADRKCVSAGSCARGSGVVLGLRCLEHCPLNFVTYNSSCLESCPVIARYMDRYRKCYSACPHYSSGSTCVDRCPAGTYGLNATCVSACPPPLVGSRALGVCYPNSTCAKWRGPECVRHCGDLQYYDTSEGACRYPCPRSAPYYNPTLSACTDRCPHYADIIHHVCVSACEASQYPNASGVCEPCHELCDGCTDVTVAGCKRCRYAENVGDGRPKCERDCSGGRFAFQMTDVNMTSLSCYTRSRNWKHVSTPCPSVSPTYCVDSCENLAQDVWNHLFTGNIHSSHNPFPPVKSVDDTRRRCVITCPASHPYTSGQSCVRKCPAASPYIANTTCMAACPHNSGVLPGGGAVCTPCAYILSGYCRSGCPLSHRFMNGSHCLNACSQGQFVLNGTHCVHRCPDFLPLAVNRKCSASCAAGQFVVEHTNNQWDSQSGTWLTWLGCEDKCEDLVVPWRGAQMQCVRECPPDLPYSLTTEHGRRCSPICAPPLAVQQDSNTCSETCPSTAPYIVETNGTRRCRDRCPGTHGFLVENVCSTACPPDLYRHYDPAPALYRCSRQCPYNMIANTTGGVRACSTCEDPALYAHGDRCVPRCPPSTWHLEETLRRGCVPVCPDGFLHLPAAGPDDDARCVTACPDDRMRIHNATCDKRCPEGAGIEVLSGAGYECVSQCPGKDGKDGYVVLEGGTTVVLNQPVRGRARCVDDCPRDVGNFTYRGVCVPRCPPGTLHRVYLTFDVQPWESPFRCDLISRRRTVITLVVSIVCLAYQIITWFKRLPVSDAFDAAQRTNICRSRAMFCICWPLLLLDTHRWRMLRVAGKSADALYRAAMDDQSVVWALNKWERSLIYHENA